MTEQKPRSYFIKCVDCIFHTRNMDNLSVRIFYFVKIFL